MLETHEKPEQGFNITISSNQGRVTVSGLVRISKSIPFPRRFGRWVLMAVFGGGAALLGGHHADAALHLVQIGLGAAFGYVAHPTQ